MPAAFDSVQLGSIGSEASFSGPTPTGTPSLAVVSIHFRGNADGTTDFLSATYGGQSMTRIVFISHKNASSGPAEANANVVIIFKLENPPSGQQTVAVTRTGSVTTAIVIACRLYTGTGTVGTVETDYSDPDSDRTTADILAITSQTDGIVIDAISTQEDEDHTCAQDNAGRERFDDADGAAQAGGSDAAGAASVDMGWSWTTGSRFAYAAFPVAPAGGITDLAVNVTNMVDGSVPLTWTDDASQARVHRSQEGGFTPDDDTWIGSIASDDTDYTDNATNSDEAPSPDVVYYYKITDDSNVAISNEVQQQMSPPRPLSLITGTITDATVELTSQNAGSTTRNRLDWWYRPSTGGALTHLGEFSSLDVTQTYLNLSAGTEYEFLVRSGSTETGLYSGFTTVVQSTAGAAPTGTITGLVYSNLAADGFDLDWTDGVTGETGYYLHLSQTPGFIASPATRYGSDLGADAESGSYTGLDPETPHYVRVEAYNAGGSVYSEEYGPVTTLEAPVEGAIAAGVFAYHDFRYPGLDPLAGRATPIFNLRGVAPMTDLQGRLVQVPATAAPKAQLVSVQPADQAVGSTRRLWPGDSVRVLRLYGAATNVDTASADLSGWTLSNLTLTPNVGEGANGKTEADQLEDASGAAIGTATEDLTIADDSTAWCAAVYVEKHRVVSAALMRFRAELVGGSTEVLGGIDFWPDTGQYDVLGDSLTGFVRDEGDRWLVVVILVNNGTGNTTLRRVYVPAWDDAFSGGGDVTLQQAVVLWGHDVKNQPFWSPHVETAGAQASHSARDASFNWPLGPQGGAWYMRLFPWFVPGHGQGFYRIYSIGGHVDNAGTKGLAIWVSSVGTDRLGFKLANGTTTVVLECNTTWRPGDPLEVYFALVPTGTPGEVELYLSTAVSNGAWTDAGPSTPIALPDVWDIPKEALNEIVSSGGGRLCADYVQRKSVADYTMDAEDMRQLRVDPPKGMVAV